MRYLKLVSCSLPLLTGCAHSATAYEPMSSNGGYEEIALQRDVFRITFAGNTATPAERAADYAMLRASELALENGYTHFQVVDNASRVQTVMVNAGGGATTFATRNAFGGYTANTIQGNSYSYALEAPTSVLLVKLLRDSPPGAFDAEFLITSLRRQYKMPLSDKETARLASLRLWAHYDCRPTNRCAKGATCDMGSGVCQR